jgi:hypothetical protein
MRNRLAVAITALAAASVFCPRLSGQNNKNQAQAQAQPSAATPQGTPAATPTEITGLWDVTRSGYDFASFSKGDPPMTQWGKAQFDAAKPSQGPRGVTLSETTDKVYKCSPPGMPYIYLQIFPMQIVQTPKEVIEIFEYDHNVRYIYTDGRKHPADLTPTYNGHSIGHWEGDTLVVDTTNFTGKTTFRGSGENLHLVEHFTRTAPGQLMYEFTVNDPESFTKPWTAQIPMARAEGPLVEYACHEGNYAMEGILRGARKQEREQQ